MVSPGLSAMRRWAWQGWTRFSDRWAKPNSWTNAGWPDGLSPRRLVCVCSADRDGPRLPALYGGLAAELSYRVQLASAAFWRLQKVVCHVLRMGGDRLAKQLLFGQPSGAVPAPAARGARRSSLLDSYSIDTSSPQIPSAALRPFALGLLGAAAERPAWFSFFP